MNKKSDISPQTIILGISLFMTMILGLFIKLIIISELLAWSIGFGTYYLIETTKKK